MKRCNLNMITMRHACFTQTLSILHHCCSSPCSYAVDGSSSSSSSSCSCSSSGISSSSSSSSPPSAPFELLLGVVFFIALISTLSASTDCLLFSLLLLIVVAFPASPSLNELIVEVSLVNTVLVFSQTSSSDLWTFVMWASATAIAASYAACSSFNDF